MKRKKSLSSRRLLLSVASAICASYLFLVSVVVTSNRTPTTNNENDLPSLYQPPKLEDYIQGWDIHRNVSWVIDFAIVGFPKTGTSTLMLYLEKQESVFIFPDERCEMGTNQHVPLIRDLWPHYRPHRRMGIKCPRDLEVDIALKNYNKFFPTTKFIVGVRHPILWFQSFYNFRVNNEDEMPPPNKLIGKCRRSNHGVCTFRANFSNHLARIEPWRDVFLYDVAQLKTSEDLRPDLKEFLSLESQLSDPMIWVKPGQTGLSADRAKDIDRRKMNICEEQYTQLRAVLAQIASESATWIRESFLTNPKVKVSSPETFHRILETWHHDPCDKTPHR